MGRKKSNNALNKENKSKSFSVSSKNVDDDCVVGKNNSTIQATVKSNSKKVKKAGLKAHFQTLNADIVQKKNSSIPAASKLNMTYQIREMSVVLEKLDVINKMIATTSLDANSDILANINTRKRKRTQNTEMKLSPKRKRDMLLKQDQSVQTMKRDMLLKQDQSVQTMKRDMLLKQDQSVLTMKIEEKRSANQIKDLKIIITNLQTPTKGGKKKDKGLLQSPSTNSNVKNDKTCKKQRLELFPIPKKVKNNKNNSVQSMDTENTEKNSITSQIKYAQMPPESLKANNKSFQSINKKTIEKHGIADQIKDVQVSPEPKKAKDNKSKSLRSNTKSIEKKGIAGQIKVVKTSLELKKPKKEKDCLEPKNAKGIEENGTAGQKKGFEMPPELKKPKVEKEGLQPTNVFMFFNIEKNGIAGELNDMVNIKIKKSSRKVVEHLTADHLKDLINLQKSRIYEMKRDKRLEPMNAEGIEKKGISGQIQDLVNLEKPRNNGTKYCIDIEIRLLKNLRKRLYYKMKKEKAPQLYVTGPPELVEDRLNSYVKRELSSTTRTIIDVNARIGLLANISWSELLADLPKEGRVMIFESPSLLVPFLSECEPLLSLRQVINDLWLVVQKEQEIEELGEELKSTQIPDAILENNKPFLPLTDNSKAKVETAPVPTVELEETDNSEKEQEEKPRKKKRMGFRKRNHSIESDSSWQGSSAEVSGEGSSDESGEESHVKIIKKELRLNEIVNLNIKSVSDNPSCLRSDNYFNKPVGKFLMGIGSDLALEYFQRDIVREQMRRLREHKKRKKPIHPIRKAISFLCKNLQMAAEVNFDFKFKQKNCKFCSFQSESMHVMALHMNSPHNIIDDKYKCNYCNIEMNSSSVILAHMSSAHGISGHVEAPLREFPCSFWDLPAKLMPKKSFKSSDKFVDDIRAFLSLKSSMGLGSGDCGRQTITDNLEVTPPVAAGES